MDEAGVVGDNRSLEVENKLQSSQLQAPGSGNAAFILNALDKAVQNAPQLNRLSMMALERICFQIA